MKVQNELDTTVFHAPVVHAKREVGVNASQQAATTPPVDRASLTGIATTLADGALRDAPAEISEERISALKAAILAGTLRIQPQSLAKCVIDQEAGRV